MKIEKKNESKIEFYQLRLFIMININKYTFTMDNEIK